MGFRKFPPKAKRREIKREFKRADMNIEKLLNKEVSTRISTKEFAMKEVKPLEEALFEKNKIPGRDFKIMEITSRIQDRIIMNLRLPLARRKRACMMGKKLAELQMLRGKARRKKVPRQAAINVVRGILRQVELFKSLEKSWRATGNGTDERKVGLSTISKMKQIYGKKLIELERDRADEIVFLDENTLNSAIALNKLELKIILGSQFEFFAGELAKVLAPFKRR